MNHIVTLLREIRIEKKITLVELARDLGTSYGNIADWERGIHEPKISSLEKWAAALGYEIDLMLIREKESAK